MRLLSWFSALLLPLCGRWGRRLASLSFWGSLPLQVTVQARVPMPMHLQGQGRTLKALCYLFLAPARCTRDEAPQGRGQKRNGRYRRRKGEGVTLTVNGGATAWREGFAVLGAAAQGLYEETRILRERMDGQGDEQAGQVMALLQSVLVQVDVCLALAPGVEEEYEAAQQRAVAEGKAAYPELEPETGGSLVRLMGLLERAAASAGDGGEEPPAGGDGVAAGDDAEGEEPPAP